jgi:hypothetical protein
MFCTDAVAACSSLGLKKMVWFPLHAPENVDTAEIFFYIFILFLLHSRLLTPLNPPVNHPQGAEPQQKP